MTSSQMVQACVAARDSLDELETLISSHLPQEEHRAFIFSSAGAVKELLGIARYETIGRVTPEQAQHITRIRDTIASLYKLIPQHVLDALRRDHEDD